LDTGALGERGRFAAMLAQASRRANSPNLNVTKFQTSVGGNSPQGELSLEERLRNIRKDAPRDAPTSWQSGFKETKLKEKISRFQEIKQETTDRSSARATESVKHAQQSSQRVDHEDELRKQRRAQEDAEWERKRNALKSHLNQTQQQQKAEREQKNKLWEAHQQDLDHRLRSERDRIHQEAERAESKLREQHEVKEQKRLREEARRDAENRQRKAQADAELNQRKQREEQWKHVDNKEMEDKKARIQATLSQYRTTVKQNREVSLDELWAQLEQKAKQGKITMSDIPFPSEKTVRIQIRDKKAFQTNALRWHPDKFIQKFGTLLGDSEREEVLKQVTEVFQVIQKCSK